jgi:hypothetical protein
VPNEILAIVVCSSALRVCWQVAVAGFQRLFAQFDDDGSGELEQVLRRRARNALGTATH